MIAVVGHHHAFLRWCYDKNIDPRSKEFINITRRDQVLGRDFGDCFYIGEVCASLDDAWHEVNLRIAMRKPSKEAK